MTAADVRTYSAQARSIDTFGRVLCNARNHHFIADGPVQNGCPGEALTPGELFLAGVASCGVELMQVIAKAHDVPLKTASVSIDGVVDRGNPIRSDVTVFNKVRLRVHLTGLSEQQGKDLVAGFQRRCPLYGSVSASCPDVQTEIQVDP